MGEAAQGAKVSAGVMAKIGRALGGASRPETPYRDISERIEGRGCW